MPADQEITGGPPAARDRDKMVRQLSLVAYLMARSGRRVDAGTIRWNVEGYGDDDQSWEAFTRRFYADREELAGLGIDIVHERGESGVTEGYWLPPENFFLPPVSFSREELAALSACLCLLDGQFAYSRLLRLALQGLALGTGNALEDPATDCFSVDLPSSGYDRAVAASQRDIENAIARRKTIRFDYRSLSGEDPRRRTVDPYAMMLTRGSWYLVGFSHERKAIRIFKLSRIWGRIAMRSKYDHNFEPPDDFRVQDYLSLEPWQLGPVRGEAVIEFSPAMGWWAQQNLATGGAVEMQPDGSARFTTPYGDPGPLVSLVLGLSGAARPVEPPALLREMAASLEAVEAAHRGPAPRPPAPAPAPPAGERRSMPREAPQVAPERFAQLATAIAYLVDKLGERETAVLPLDRVRHDLGFKSRRSLEQALDLLRLVNTGAGGYLVEAYVRDGEVHVSGWPWGDLFKRPAHLSPREARAMLLAIDLVGSHMLGGRFGSLAGAREKIIKAAGGLDQSQMIAVGETEKDDFNICRVVNQGLSERRLVEIEYLSQDSAGPTRRRVEPYLVQQTQGRWYLVGWCHKRDALRTFRFEMMKSARLLKQGFRPRELDLQPYRSDPSGGRPFKRARVLFSPEEAPLAGESRPSAQLLADGSLLDEMPYFTIQWLAREIIRQRGRAVVIAPAEARRAVAAAARRWLDHPWPAEPGPG